MALSIHRSRRKATRHLRHSLRPQWGYMLPLHSNQYPVPSLARDYLYLAVNSCYREEYAQAYDRCRRALGWANVKGDCDAKATALKFMSWLRTGGFV